VIVGLMGAFMTAAYMTRCIYLTFFGEYRGGHAHADAVEAEHVPETIVDSQESVDAHGHEGPHESNWLLTMPLWVLSGFAIFAGLINFPHFSKFEKWFQPRVFFVEAPEVAFNPILAAISVAIALIGVGIAWAFYTGRLAALRDLSARNAAARFGKTILVNKYYLDWLYTDVIVGSIKGPIARGVYWFNQKVIDNVLNYTGRGARVLGRFTYDYIDQKGVDGLVNGLATVTGESGGAVRKIQTGRLQFYALMLVVAVGLFAVALWIFT
jgi:NADH-quinone oxidoreductase subunit L